MSSKAYYPVFLDLYGRRCLVVGGGLVAERKVTTLLQFGARIRVVSPSLTKRLKRYVKQGTIRHIARRFRTSDLQGLWLVYAATDDQRTNTLVSRTANQTRIFANIVDQPRLCSFIAPAIMKRKDLVIAISTGGASPTVAKHLRRELDRTIGSDYARLLELLGSLRGIAKRRLPRYEDRKRFFAQLVNGRVFELVRLGKSGVARREALAWLEASAMRNSV